MKKNSIILLICFVNIYACNKTDKISTKNKNNTTYIDTIKTPIMKIDEQAIKNYYKDHISVSPHQDEEEDYFVTENDVDLMIPVLLEGLKNNGFKFLDKETYRNKLKEIFNISDATMCPILFRHSNFFTYVVQDCKNMDSGSCNENAKLMEFFNFENVFFINNYSTITSLPKVELFTELKNDKIVINVPTNIIYRNLFLFNDDNSKYLWLLKNDTDFMENLVKEFGYTKNTNLLKWVIERTKFNNNNPQDYGKLFWVKQCDGTLKIHSNTFKILQKIYTPDIINDMSNDNRFLLDYIKDYIQYFADENNKETIISNEDRIKILANISYYAEQYKYDKRFVSGHGDNSMIMGRLRFFLAQEDVEILKKNNYFNLPKFKEWWDNADYDEYYVTECEYGGSCGEGNEPMDYNEWRKQNPKK